MSKILIIILFLIVCLAKSSTTYAIEDPLVRQNNKFGIHILFISELENASQLINSSGGDWGYVTIPIQVGDKDIEKWQNFMNEAKERHIIPIMRLASENYYFETRVWKKPSEEDILDFANFLNSLDWPVKNRYIIVFNEVNRGDEWQGLPDPAEYAQMLAYAVTAFKSLNEDFFIISSGLDNAAPNESGKYMNEYDYMAAMDNAVPGIFGLVDGLGSHSYPNPGFRQMPYILTSQSIYSFNFEKNTAYRLSGKNLPVFITETGWSKEALSENQIGQYFKYAFDYVWADKDIVAVTPFLLQAGTEPFSKFSLMDGNGEKNEIFTTIAGISKIKGKPTVNYGTSISSSLLPKKIPVKIFPKKIQYRGIPLEKTDAITDFFKWFLKLSN